MSTIDDAIVIRNKVDFQRHLNGCERRLIDLTKTIQSLDHQLQKLPIDNVNKSHDQYRIFLDNFHRTCAQQESLNKNVSTLFESEFASNAIRRLKTLKNNIQPNVIRFETIKTAIEQKFGIGFIRIDIDDDNNIVDDEQQQQKMKMIQYEQETIELDLINQRAQTFDRLEKDLTDLRETFSDLERIVYEQGTIVDNIEQALSHADEMVVEAVENVNTAVNQKKRSSRTKWICLILIIVALLIVLLILYFTLKFAFPFG